MPSNYTEDSLVEQPAIALLGELGWETANCFYESFHDSPSPSSSPRGRGGPEDPAGGGAEPCGRGHRLKKSGRYDVSKLPEAQFEPGSRTVM